MSLPGAGFSALDRIAERAGTAGRSICMATGTGAHPAWLARAHPEATRTDFDGRKHRYGQRHNACPSPPAVDRAGPPRGTTTRPRTPLRPGWAWPTT